MRRRAIITLAASVSIVAATQASILSYSVQRGGFYLQTAPDQAPSAVEFQYLLGLSTTAASDVGSATFSSGGGTIPLAPSSVPGSSTVQWGAGGAFGTEPQLDAFIPFGTATFEVAGGMLGAGSATVNVEPSVMPSAAPQFEPATFAALQGMDPTDDFIVNFNGFASATVLSQVALAWKSADNTEVGVQAASASATSILIPGGTFSPHTEYELTLVFASTTVTPALNPGPFLGSVGLAQGLRTTRMFFTTLPEPGAGLALLLGAFLAVPRASRRGA